MRFPAPPGFSTLPRPYAGAIEFSTQRTPRQPAICAPRSQARRQSLRACKASNARKSLWRALRQCAKMETIPLKYSARSWNYKLVERNACAAIYSQSKHPDLPENGKAAAWEVVLIRTQPTRKLDRRQRTCRKRTVARWQRLGPLWLDLPYAGPRSREACRGIHAGAYRSGSQGARGSGSLTGWPIVAISGVCGGSASELAGQLAARVYLKP